MAVHIAHTVPTEDLPGKFACKESLLTSQYVGKPVLVTRVKGQRVYYKFAEALWSNDGSLRGSTSWRPPSEDAEEEYCTHKTLRVVCDTLEEAAAVTAAARRFFEEDIAREAQRRYEFFQGALLGSLPELAAVARPTQGSTT